MSRQLNQHPAQPAPDRVTRGCGGNALDAAETAFIQLATGLSLLAVDGASIGYGLPDRMIGLIELRTILLHPSTGYPARDAAWAELVSRSREQGVAWVVGCIGVAMPGLKSAAARLTGDQWSADADDIIAALVSGFMDALGRVQIDRHSIAPRLLWMARRAALRARRAAVECLTLPPTVLESVRLQSAGGHPDLLLADAVRQGVITAADADMIGATRLDDIDLVDYARDHGIPRWRAYKRRERAEARLVRALKNGQLSSAARAVILADQPRMDSHRPVTQAA